MESGILPAVDLISTTSSLTTQEMVGDRHYVLVTEVRKIMQKYNDLRGVIAIIGESELSLQDRSDYQKAKQLIEYFAQPLFVAESMTGKKGEYVTREEMLDGVEEIIAGR